MCWLCSTSMRPNVVQQYCDIKKVLRSGGAFDLRGLVSKGYRTTQETKLCTAITRAIRESSWANASINSSGAHPPRATARHLLTLSVPGVGLLVAPGAGHQHTRGDPRAFDTRVFQRPISLSERIRPLSKTGLSVRDQKNLSMFLKVCFLNFRYFYISWKHINISDKVNYILFITKQSLT